MIENQADRGRICSDGHTCHIQSGSAVGTTTHACRGGKDCSSIFARTQNLIPGTFLLAFASARGAAEVHLKMCEKVDVLS
jgi:hypothetical protein